MFPIDIKTDEKSHCRCKDCNWTEDDSGHIDVVRGAWNTAQHVADTGHTVVEEQIKTMTVSSPIAGSLTLPQDVA